MSDPVDEAERRLAAWRTEHPAIAEAVHARIDRMYAGSQISEAVEQVVADEVAQRGEGKRNAREQARWSEVMDHAHDPARTREVFGAVINLYLDDIAGGFDRRLYLAVMATLPRAFDVLFRSRYSITGPIEHLRMLARDHTLVFTPTHSSHLDSFVAGIALRRSKLPPVAYAAGKHMYRNPVIARVLGNLGTYRVDRGLAATLYKDVLKAYAAELVERGFHSMIFPGATRSRTNEVESQLKLGLLGTTLGAARPTRIIPVTISYLVVLEAPSLIRHFLAGKAGQRIGTGSPRAAGVIAAMRRLMALDEAVVVAFGEPLDPASTELPQLVTAVTASYRRDTVLFPTHVVARALHDLAIEQTGASEIHELIRLGGCGFPATEVRARVARVVTLIQGNRSGGMLAPTIDPQDPDAIITTALNAWAACHPRPVAVRRGHEVTIEDVSLVYFYRNRTAHL